MTQIYVFVDDYLKRHPGQAAWRRSNNAVPAFTDAEVLTIGLLQGAFGCATLKKTYQKEDIPKRRHTNWSPPTGTAPFRSYAATGRGWPAFMRWRLSQDNSCKPIGHGRVRLLHEDGARFGKSTVGWYFGFTLHTLIHRSGAILSAILTPANWDEHDTALALALAVDGGVVLADLGYDSKDDELAQTLAEEADLLVIHPAEAGDKKIGAQTNPRRALVSALRERIETSFSGLWNRFVDRIYSRSWQGLWSSLKLKWSSLKLKMLHFNLCHAGLLPN